MIRDHFLVHRADVFAGMKLSAQIFPFAEMPNIAIMSPLCFCSRFPLRKPCRFPMRVQPIKSQMEPADTREQFTDRLLHKVLP